MTGSPPDAAELAGASVPRGTGDTARVQTKITVADPALMVNLLGSHDEILLLVEERWNRWFWELIRAEIVRQ